MPSSKRRLALTLDDDLAAVLEDFAKVSGTAKASFIVSLLRENIPLIQGMTKAFKMAKKSPADALNIMQEQMLQAQIKAAQGSLDLDKKQNKIRPRKRNK